MIDHTPSPAVEVLPLQKSGGRFGMAVAVSAALHVGLLVLVLGHLAAERGGGGHLLEAIEIEVVDAVAQESASPSADHSGGHPVAAPAQSTAATMAAAASQSERHVSTPGSLELTAAADAAPATARTEPATRNEVAHEPGVVQRSDMQAASAAASAATANAGATATMVAAAAEPGTAAAAASPGEVARFNAEVRKALGRSRPRGWPTGHLLLAFSVSESGRVENAELMRASASARLNRLTLDWIATVDMPVPPHGLPPAERRYAIPITVK